MNSSFFQTTFRSQCRWPRIYRPSVRQMQWFISSMSHSVTAKNYSTWRAKCDYSLLAAVFEFMWYHALVACDKFIYIVVTDVCGVWYKMSRQNRLLRRLLAVCLFVMFSFPGPHKYCLQEYWVTLTPFFCVYLLKVSWAGYMLKFSFKRGKIGLWRT